MPGTGHKRGCGRPELGLSEVRACNFCTCVFKRGGTREKRQTKTKTGGTLARAARNLCVKWCAGEPGASRVQVLSMAGARSLPAGSWFAGFAQVKLWLVCCPGCDGRA